MRPFLEEEKGEAGRKEGAKERSIPKKKNCFSRG